MDRTLSELEIINTWLGGNNVTMSALRELIAGIDRREKVRIVDLGCGRGDILQSIEKWSKKNRLNVHLTGIDANDYIVNAAIENLPRDSQIEFKSIDILSSEFQSQQFDIIIGTLFFHHFSDQQLISFFSGLKNQAKIGFIVNDIHRHPIAFYSILLLTRLFSRSSMVKYDAPLSVMRAFKRRELVSILHQAGIQNFKIRWKWAFRWQVLAYPGGSH
jgi:2-polyprenyl-3-methyl-5-hydroxy-6-metoxy-1,4-benzoquinol methylase